MKTKFTILAILFFGYCFSQTNNVYRVYFRNGKTQDVLNLTKVPNAINCESLDGMNTLSFTDKDYYSFRRLDNNLPFFEFKEKMFTDYVVINIDSLNQKKLYERTLNWVKETFKNPDKVIKMTIENEKIRIEGYKENLYCVKGIFSMASCYNGTFTIEISFKDGKYKFDPTYIEYHVPASQYNKANDVQFQLNDFRGLYNEKGELRNAFEFLPITIDILFNNLNLELYEYIISSGKKDNW